LAEPPAALERAEEAVDMVGVEGRSPAEGRSAAEVLAAAEGRSAAAV
jgi:hypothetical protein